MQRLLKIIYRYRSFFTFIFLELVCGILIIQNNRFQSAAFFNSSNFLSASVLDLSTTIRHYFYLEEINQSLAEENSLLRTLLEQNQVSFSDSIEVDSVKQFEFITAKVINNSTKWQNNSLTINKGITSGVEQEMGVLGSGGVVGKVRYVNKKFGVITSLLHTKFTISSHIKEKVELCTIEWDGIDPNQVQVKYVPRHHIIEVGDSVLTSGYNSIFPANVPIAVVSEVNLNPDETFYQLKAELVNDFSNLSYVHIVVNKYKYEKDSVEFLLNQDE